MEINIISLENRKGVELGAVKKVRRGYARYLIREKKALPYDKTQMEQFTKMRASLEQQESEKLAEAQARAEKLKALEVCIESRAQEEGQLYGSLGAKEIAEAITKAGVSVEKQAIQLDTASIRQIGNHEVMVHLHDQVKAKVTIKVVPAAS